MTGTATQRTLGTDDLSMRAAAYAAHYRRLGLAPGDRVAILAEKSPDVVAAFLGASLAAVTYVPLDPKAHPDYWAQVMSDLGVAALLSDRPETAAPPAPIRVSAMLPDDEAAPDPQEPEPRSAHDPAYILTTSGSTGRPKGVLLSHENALAFVRWAAETIGLGPDDVVLNVSPFHFDLSVFDIYASLMCGARLVIASAEAVMFPGELSNLIEQHRVSVLYSVPTNLRALVAADGLGGARGRSLRAVVYAGEPYPVPELRQLMARLPHASFHNFFGPTETNVCLAHRFPGPPETDLDDVPIGMPASGASIRLLDETGAEIGDGDVGEIVVDGATVMLGYLSAAGFESAHRPYRTGDFAVRDASGLHYFRGRRDQQVKVRGNRIELQAIERALQACPGVREIAVLVDADSLIAFVVGEESLDPRDLRAACAQALPPGSVPREYRVVAAFPRLSNGKLDRRRLAEQAGLGRGQAR